MPSYIPHRLLFDSKAITEINGKLDKTSFWNFIYNLMYINTNSRQNKKNQIITSGKSFQDISTALVSNEVDGSTFSILEPAIRPQHKPEHIEAISVETERIWELAVYVSGLEPPFQSIIFTTKTDLPTYETYRTRDMKDNIIINDTDQALIRIAAYFKLIQEDKEG